MSLDTEYWRLVCEVSFRKTRDPLYKIEACSCKLPFASMWDDRCDKCNGTGYEKIPLPYPEKPAIPQDLLDTLSKVYKEWVDAKCAERQYE